MRIRDALGCGAESAGRLLQTLTRVGALAPVPQLAARRRAPRAITHLCIPTRDRARSSLPRALDSHLRMLSDLGRRPTLIIANDSTSAASEAATLAITRRAARHYGFHCLYVGPKERAALALAAARELRCDPVRLSCLLTPARYDDSPGSARNALLAFSRGDLALMVDDDTRGEFWRSPNSRTGLAIAVDRDPSQIWLTREEAGLKRQMGDPYSAHEQLCGAALGQLFVRAARCRPDVLSARLIHDIFDSQSRIIATCAGVFGDCALDDAASILYAPLRTREQLSADAGLYRRFMTGRQFIRGVSEVIVCRAPVAQTVAICFDNTTLVPPFPPRGRNEDGVFAQVASRCPGAYLGFIPGMITHAPVGHCSFRSKISEHI